MRMKEISLCAVHVKCGLGCFWKSWTLQRALATGHVHFSKPNIDEEKLQRKKRRTYKPMDQKLRKEILFAQRQRVPWGIVFNITIHYSVSIVLCFA